MIIGLESVSLINNLGWGRSSKEHFIIVARTLNHL